LQRPQQGENRTAVADTARKAFVATIVAVAVIAVALALWKLKIVLALIFLGFIVAAAMRPGVDRLAEHRIPRPLGVALHYLALIAAIGLLLWLAVPRAIDQVQTAIGTLPEATRHSTGVKHQILAGLDRRLRHLPTGEQIVHPALNASVKAFEIGIGIFFMLASAAYWVVERDRFIDFVVSTVPRAKRKRVRDTWILIDAKLGAFVRGQA
jgi:predicted PurR-regulated permease PerM